MSTIVCEGLQSCHEPRLVEPLVIRPKLSPPNSKFSQSSLCQNEEEKNSEDDNNENNSNNGEPGGWNFIQALTNSSQNYKKVFFDDTQKVYVHPLDKKSLSALSSKSLEMCTEGLGCETGSDISESSDEFSFSSSLSGRREKMERSKCKVFSKKVSQSYSFPPPLTSISGSDGVQVRPRREGGRLVLQAVTVSSHNSCFLADRTDGRLTLSLVKDCCVNKVNVKEEENDNVVEVEEEDEEEGQLYDEGDDSECGEDEDDEDSEDGCWVGDMEGNSGTVGCENGMGELLRPSGCKEGMPIWGQIRVAIS